MHGWSILATLSTACALAAFGASAHAEVFRCSTAAGKTLYSDAPCPRGTRSENISAKVGECDSEACRVEREHRAAAARARLNEEKAALAELTEQRRRTDAQAWADRVQLEALRRIAVLEARLAPAQPSDSSRFRSPAFPWYPGVAVPRCMRCFHPRPLLAHKPYRAHERGLPLTGGGRHRHR